MELQRKPAHLRLAAAQTALFASLEELGCQGRVVAIRHLNDLQERLEDPHRRGLIDENLYQERLAGLVFNPPDQLQDAQSIIIAAYPDLQTSVTFQWNGERVRLIIPPTFIHKRDQRIKEHLQKTLEPMGYSLTGAIVPKKLLAVCGGLGEYGRNNLCYLNGLGSVVRFIAFYSDLPCEEDHWREPQLMEACQKCSACRHRCPTGAIPEDRFLLRAERCITFHNKRSGHIPFPYWIDPAWHSFLVGCLACQRICPQNKGLLDNIIVGADFSQEETSLLLQGQPMGQMPDPLVEKLMQVDLIGMLDLIPRNLSKFLERVVH